MSDKELFYIFGIGLAISAVVLTFAGLKLKNFPGKALPVIVLYFVVMVVGASTFAVRESKHEAEGHAAEHHKAAEEIEEGSSGPYENEAGALGGESEELEEEAEEEAPGSTEEEPVGPTEESQFNPESRGNQPGDGALGSEREELEDQSEELEREGDVEVGEGGGK